MNGGKLRTKILGSRIEIFKVCLFLAFFVIVGRLFQVQVLQHDYYVAKANARQMKSFKISARRGELYVRDGDNKVAPIVMNERVWTIYLDPKYIGKTGRKETEQKLTEILGDEMELTWEKIWSDSERQYVEIAHNITYGKAKKIDEVKLRGVGKHEESRRVYPKGTMAAQLLGFINTESKGSGVEYALNERLAGKDGLLKTVKDVSNIPLTIGNNNIDIPAEDGEDIVLTIDENIQRKAEEVLANAVQYSGGVVSASALVMNPNNGQIMAVANMPNYNPAEYNKVKDATLFKNNISDDLYEPASVCKPFTYATALDLGVLKPSDTYVNTGSTQVEDRKIKNATNTDTVMGTVTFRKALAYSLNTGSVEALRKIGGGKISKDARNKLYDYLYNKFGLGRKTGVELYEEQGKIYSPDEMEGNAVRYANMTFGQGMSLTMIQTAAGFSSLVNGGKYYKPTLVAGTMEDGIFQEVEKVQPVRQTISEETSKTMRSMLESVREVNGGVADPQGYSIGVKTGTAETYDTSGLYTSDATVAGAVGFGGRKGKKPEYVVLVRLRGSRLLWGSEDAVPVFTEISNYMLRYLRISPS